MVTYQFPSVRELLAVAPGTAPVTVRGWVRTKRDGKQVCFFEINDGSTLKGMQAVIEKSRVDLGQAIEAMQTGASVIAHGTLVESPGKGQSVELRCDGLEVTGTAAGFPLQKKRHGFEYLREIAHLRGRTNTFGAVMRVRNTLASAVHEFFQTRGFLYLHTPIVTASDTEGAGAMFRVTTQDPGSPQAADPSDDFFGRAAYLTVSGQLAAEAYATALSRVYTFGPTFRAEHSNTTRHLAEFWMIEPEVAFCDLDCVVELAADFVRHLILSCLEHNGEDMAFFDTRIAPGIVADLERVARCEFQRLSYSDAIGALAETDTEFEHPIEWGSDLQTEHERYLCDVVAGGPVVVTDYPREIKAFYMKQNADGRTVRAMDVLVPRLGEIIGGSQREERLDALTDRMAQLGMDAAEYDWYLDLRRYGTVPHSGFGLGFERMVRYVTGMENIRDVIPFPRAPGLATF